MCPTGIEEKWNKTSPKKEKKEGVMGMKTNEELELSYIPVLGGYLNFLNNLWFRFLEKLEIKEFPIQFLGEKNFPIKKPPVPVSLTSPKEWAVFTKYGAKNR